MKFVLDMSKEEFRALYEEIDRSESPVLMDFYMKLSARAIRQAEKNRKEAESIFTINEIDTENKINKETEK